MCGVRQSPVCGVESNTATAMYSTSCIPSCARIVKQTAPQCVGFLILFTHSMYIVHVYVHYKNVVVLRTLRSC